MTNPSQAYFQTQVGTTSQGELLLMLYDGALKFLTLAKEKMLAKDVAAKGMLISKALDIINELDNVLDIQEGGDLAKNLHQLYFMCINRLLQANLKQDPQKLDSVMEILRGLRSAYAQILKRPEAQAAAAHIAAKQKGRGTMPARGSAPSALTHQAPGTGLGRTQANQMYTQLQQQGNFGVVPTVSQPEAFCAPAPLAQPHMPPQAVTPTMSTAVTGMSAMLHAPVGGFAATKAAASVAPAAPTIPVTPPAAASTPVPAPSATATAPNAPAAAPTGFGSRRLAASAFYAKQSS